MTTVEGLIPSGPIQNDMPVDRETAQRDMLNNTERIQAYLDAAVTEHRGAVSIPAGSYWVCTITIPDDTELHLDAGAVLKAWPYIEDYTAIRPYDWSGTDDVHKNVFQGYALIRARDVRRPALTGRGAVDGSGFAFWDVPVRNHVARGGTREELGVPEHWEEDSPFWREREPRLSPLIEFVRSSQVLIRDVEIRNAAGWTLHPMTCDDVTIENIVIDNHFYGPNTDGIDVNGCRDVTIRGCRVRCGDDAIILKASKEAGRSCERVVISDCLLETHCAAVGLGAEVSYPIRDISVSNVVVGRALRMVQIELWNAGLVENVVVSGMTGANMTDIPLERPLYIDIQHHGRSDGALGAVRNVQIRGVTATSRGRCLFTAADGSTIEGLVLDGIQLTIPEIEDPRESVVSSRSNQMSNDNPETRVARAAFIFDNVRDVALSGLQIRWPDRDRADRAAELRPTFDRGELSRDRRKQEALGGDPPMHALMLRNCSSLHADLPNLRGFKAAAVSTLGELRDCEIRSAEGTYE